MSSTYRKWGYTKMAAKNDISEYMLKKQRTATKQNKSKVLIVDDHPIVREGLVALIDRQGDLKVCGQADDAYDALKSIDKLKPNVVIVDISLKGSNGIELTKSIRAQYPALPVIVFSFHDESLYAERALQAGASAYLTKKADSEKILKAIRTVLNGELYVSDELSKKLLHKIIGDKTGKTITPIDNFSDREFEVFRLIGQGYRAAEAAKQLHLSSKTIETYRERIKRKLGLGDSSELLRYAIKWSRNHETE